VPTATAGPTRYTAVPASTAARATSKGAQGRTIGAAFPGDGTEFVYGGEGKDEIVADDDSKDIIDCGDGHDTVFFDQGLDRLKNCEDKTPS
jgi:hypothetical protein